MKKKLKYRVGDWVHIERTTKMEYGVIRDKWHWKGLCKVDCGLDGQIVGAVYRNTGIRESDGENGYYFVPDPAPAFLLYQIRLGMLNEPIEAMEEDLQDTAVYLGQELPLKYMTPMTDEDKESLSKYMKEEMKDWPRDAKGRWMK